MATALFLTLVAEGAAVRADERGPILTLEWALRHARAANPELKALTSEREAAWERVPQARSFEDPTLGVQLWDFPFTRRPGAGSMVMVQVSQPLPFPGKRRLRGEVAEKGARVAGENLRSREVELVAQVKHLYYALWVNLSARRINLRNQELLEQVRKTANVRLATAQVGIADVFRAETEKARLRLEHRNLERDREVLVAALNARLGRSADTPLGEPVEYFPSGAGYRYEALVVAALARRPELKTARLEVERAEAQSRLARRERWPDLMPTFMIMQDIEEGTSWGGMLGITVPIWLGQRQGRAVRESVSLLGAAGERERAERLELEREIKEALAAYRSALDRVTLIRNEVLPKARGSLDAIVSAYTTGRESLTTLLDARRVVQDQELELERERAAAEQARAELEREVGAALPSSR